MVFSGDSLLQETMVPPQGGHVTFVVETGDANWYGFMLMSEATRGRSGPAKSRGSDSACGAANPIANDGPANWSRFSVMVSPMRSPDYASRG